MWVWTERDNWSLKGFLYNEQATRTLQILFLFIVQTRPVPHLVLAATEVVDVVELLGADGGHSREEGQDEGGEVVHGVGGKDVFVQACEGTDCGRGQGRGQIK